MSSIEHRFYRLCLAAMKHRKRSSDTDRPNFFDNMVVLKISLGKLVIKSTSERLLVYIETSSMSHYEIFMRDNKTHRYPVCRTATVEQVMRCLEQELALDLLSDV